jgi:hypothetical protein
VVEAGEENNVIPADRPVVLIGGISGDDARQAMTAAGVALADLLPGITDGETNIRRFWVLATAHRIWRQHPDLTMTYRPRGVPGMPEWVPDGYDDLPKFAPRAGVTSIDVPTLVYPQEAIRGYEVFRTLRADGVLPRDGLRFQVSLPFPEDACRLFATDPDHADLLIDAYLRAMRSDVAQICAGIPHHDLLIQWDINWETIAIDFGDHLADLPPMDYKMHGDPLERFQTYMAKLSCDIPEQVKLGIHVCYGDLHYRHFLEPRDLRAPVRMASAAVRFAGRRVDYVHMPVPVHVGDDAYFAPLRDFPADDATLYLGLLHPADGLNGAKARLELARHHFNGHVGIGTECGLGRRPPGEDFGRLLALHREVADAI